MNYETLTNEKKLNIDMNDLTLQYSPSFQLTEVNRTRKILITLTGFEFAISLLCTIAVIYSYAFGYDLGIESYNPIVRFLPLVSCICFFIGLIAADRYHIKGLLVFEKLLMLDLILTHLILTIFIIIPICLKTYKISIFTTITVALGYEIIFCIVAFVPGYTIRNANKLSKLLTDTTCSTTK